MFIFESEKGVALILTFIILVSLACVAFAFLTMVGDEIRSVGAGLWNMRAFYIAEAGLAKARWALTTGGQAVGWGEPPASPFGSGNGTYVVTTDYSDRPTNQHVIITSNGYIPDNTNYVARRQVVENNIPVTVGTNLSLDVTIFASSEKLPSNPKENANDGDGDSSWKAGSKDDAWLKLDFGSSTTFDRVRYAGNNINSVTIEYSDNDSSYTEVTNAVEDPTGTVNFDPVSARYLKFSTDVDSNKTAEASELETYNTAMGGLGQGTFSTSW